MFFLTNVVMSSLAQGRHICRDFAALSHPITEICSPEIHLDNGKQIFQSSYFLFLPLPLGMQQSTSSFSLLGSLYPSKWPVEQELREPQASSSFFMDHFWSREITYILCSMKLCGETSFFSACREAGYLFLGRDGDIGPLCLQTPGDTLHFRVGEGISIAISLVFSKKHFQLFHSFSAFPNLFMDQRWVFS